MSYQLFLAIKENAIISTCVDYSPVLNNIFFIPQPLVNFRKSPVFPLPLPLDSNEVYEHIFSCFFNNNNVR